MLINKPGSISEKIILLGKRESCVYLIDGGNEYALLGGGMAYIIPDILKQVDLFGIDESKVTRIIVHHAHFDHVGIVPFFKKRWPHMKVLASRRAKEILSNSEIINTIVKLNTQLLSKYGLKHTADQLGLDITEIQVDQVISEGDIIISGDTSLEVLETPGHSTCSISIYIPQDRILSTSDAGGIPFGNSILTAANSNFGLYMQSLRKMQKYDVEFHLSEHHGVSTEEDARTFITRSIESAELTRSMIKESYKRTSNLEVTSEEITEFYMNQGAGDFTPRDIMKMVVTQMAKSLLKG
ncbi:MAG: MBL fold metallo-hydrolase [Desulfobacteraceae bacterium]|nr:MBL fold metallo-hydrolase [Desulfobacteraceae bacterium]